MMIEAWKKQFSLKQLSLSHDRPITFIISQWQRKPEPTLVYLIYRWAAAILFFVTWAISVVDLKHPNASPAFRAKWLIYLTNWGYTICTVQALLAAFMLTACCLALRLRSMPNLQDNTLKLYKIYWVIHTTATDIALGVTFIYWPLIYDEKTMDLDAMNIFAHANNSVMMMIDLFLVSHPVRLFHCCYPVLFGLGYAIFNVIFYVAGGISREGHRYIYPILNWNKPGSSAVVCLAVIGFIMIIHFIIWGLYKFRLWLHSKLFESEMDSVDKMTDTAKKYYDNEALASDVV